MIISSKGRYALRVMLELAQYGGDGAYIRLGDIAQRQGISRKYLESIMTALQNIMLAVGAKLQPATRTTVEEVEAREACDA